MKIFMTGRNQPNKKRQQRVLVNFYERNTAKLGVSDISQKCLTFLAKNIIYEESLIKK